MNPTAWIALGALAFNALVLAIGYGVMKGTVAALENRVKSLEAEIGTLNELKVTVAEVKTSLAFLVEQFKDLNASIRWMRDPAPPTKRAPRQP